MDDSTVLDLIPAYALGALDEADRAHVEALLTRSEAARQRLAEYEQILGGLALTVPARQAPTGSTDAFMARLQRYERDAAGPGQAASPAPRNEPPRIVQARRWRPAWLMAAAALVILLAGIGVWRWRVGLSPDSSTVIQSIMRDPSVHVVALKPTDPTGSGTLNVVVYGRPDSSDAVIDRKALPTLPAGKQYQLWMIPDGQSPIPLPAFDPAPPDQPDQTTLLVHLPGPMSSYQIVALTVEPSGGSPQPTTNPIATGSISG